MIDKARVAVVLALAAMFASAGCTAQLGQAATVGDSAPAATAASTEPPAATAASTEPPTATATSTPATALTAAPTQTPAPTATPPAPSQPAASASSSTTPSSDRITLTVPSAGIKDLPVVRYAGTPDDGPGTAINGRGLGAAPFGKWGGALPGQVGNFLVTGHRTSAGAPMYDVPNLRPGAQITVKYGSRTINYRVAERLWIDFRTEADRASQQAAVPGKPGATAARPAIVLSTCATPEDNALGLRWRDRFDNPAHRIAIVGYAS